MQDHSADSRSAGQMRVAFVSYSWGELCARLTAALAEQGDAVLLVTSLQQYDRFRHLGDPRVEVLAPPLPRLRNVVGQLRAQWRAMRAIRAFEPDVVHVQHGHMWFNLMLLFLRRYPLVITVHDPRHHLGDRSSQTVPQWILDAGFRRANRIIVHASQMIEPMVKEIRIDRDHIRVIPLIQLGDDELARDVDEQEGTVLWFGRIWKYKGLDLFIRCQPDVARRVPSSSFVIAGRGEDMEPYYDKMNDVNDFTVYNDYVSEELRARLFRESSVVVLPYVEATQSGIVMNAAAYARPVVASAVGGIVEQVDHGVTGLLVPPNDLEALSDAVVSLLLDRERRHEMGRAARAKLEQESSGARIATKTVEVYRELVGQRA